MRRALPQGSSSITKATVVPKLLGVIEPARRYNVTVAELDFTKAPSGVNKCRGPAGLRPH
jgi:hypothetical protein